MRMITDERVPEEWDIWYQRYGYGIAADYYAYGYICGRFGLNKSYGLRANHEYMMGYIDGEGDREDA